MDKTSPEETAKMYTIAFAMALLMFSAGLITTYISITDGSELSSFSTCSLLIGGCFLAFHTYKFGIRSFLHYLLYGGFTLGILLTASGLVSLIARVDYITGARYNPKISVAQILIGIGIIVIFHSIKLFMRKIHLKKTNNKELQPEGGEGRLRRPSP